MFKLSIPEPCDENWKNMSPTQKGALCAKCDKEVVDFSRMDNAQMNQLLQDFYINRKSVCGRFDNNQLQQPESAYVHVNIAKLTIKQVVYLSFVIVFFLGGFQSCKVRGRTLGIPVFEESLHKQVVPKYLEKVSNDCGNDRRTAGSVVLRRDTTVVLKDTVPILSKREMFGKMYFKTGKEELEPATIKVLDQLILNIKEKGALGITIIGHTDSIGTDAYNKKLSLSRAKAVEEYLKKSDIKVDACRGVGYQFPISNNTSMAGRASNRRVEIIIVWK